MKIAVFGASGRTGVPLVEQALDRGHEVVAFVRSPEKLSGELSVEDPALTVVEGDAYTGEGVREAVAGVDAVASVLGQTDAGPDDLLTVAGDHVLDAMAEAGVDRFVTLVGAGVREEGDSVGIAGRVMGTALKLLAGNVLDDARDHVDRVKATDLDWTVVRAPRLGDGPGTGDYRAGDVSLGLSAIDRPDVARFVLDCLEDDLYVRETPKVGPA